MPVTPFDYEACLRACAQGERQALERLYAEESARLLGVVDRLLRDRARAEDIVHDAFINIWNRAGTYDPDRGAARTWIYAVARHLALNALRDGDRETVIDEPAAEALDAREAMQAWQDDTVAESFAWRGQADRLAPCLEALEPVRRHCILHAYVDGWSHREIALRLGAPLGTVKAWVARSLRALRECLA